MNNLKKLILINLAFISFGVVAMEQTNQPSESVNISYTVTQEEDPWMKLFNYILKFNENKTKIFNLKKAQNLLDKISNEEINRIEQTSEGFSFTLYSLSKIYLKNKGTDAQKFIENIRIKGGKTTEIRSHNFQKIKLHNRTLIDRASGLITKSNSFLRQSKKLNYFNIGTLCFSFLLMIAIAQYTNKQNNKSK